ncbi:MAG: alkaline phosphatase family protein [Leptospiraceae bacterium]|nr:alkaline phosphatase family protein [Leptospiraceae bacterium]MCB1171020.1 alkaline phosphatase family protein [Leptospiraceae bacterium]
MKKTRMQAATKRTRAKQRPNGQSVPEPGTRAANLESGRHLAVINVVGLTPQLIGEHTPALKALCESRTCKPLAGVFPAVTTTVQSSMLTGLAPADHGIVGNGWYFRDLDEIAFWKQSNALVHGEKIWENLKRKHPGFQTSNLFWWYNMNTAVDFSITPKPHYGADGRKEFKVYSSPSFHAQIESRIGKFPFFTFWGPRAGIEASRWIARCSVEEFRIHRPNLQLVYLPHLDYNMQKLGPHHPTVAEDLQQIDAVVGELVEELARQGCDTMVVSEYGIEPVRRSVSINRELRKRGWLKVRESLGTELLDTGASAAFAVADHQIAHVYVKCPSIFSEVKSCLQGLDGIESVLEGADFAKMGQRPRDRTHRTGKSETSKATFRAGDLVAVADADCWLNYYYWLDDDMAPDFARTVDIHRKPGYDPVELFLDPDLTLIPLRVGWKLLKKTLGFRMLMDVIPLRPELVKGSHGRLNEPSRGPLLIAPQHYHGPLPTSVTGLFSLLQRYFNQK